MLSSRQSYTCVLQGSYFVAHGGVFNLNCPDVEEINEMNRIQVHQHLKCSMLVFGVDDGSKSLAMLFSTMNNFQFKVIWLLIR